MDEEALKQKQEAEAKAKADEEAKTKGSSTTSDDDDDDDHGDDDDKKTERTVSAKAFMDVKSKYKEAKRRLDEIERKQRERDEAELPELDRLKKENERYQQQVSQYEAEQAKLTAYSKLKRKILGDNYVIEDEERVMKAVRKLVYDEDSYEDDIADILEISKRSKKGSTQTLNLGPASKGSSKKPEDYTSKELKELERTDPAAFKDVLEQRKLARR